MSTSMNKYVHLSDIKPYSAVHTSTLCSRPHLSDNGGIGDASNSMNGHFIDLVLVDSLNSDCASGLEDGATVTTSHGSIGPSIHQ